MINNLLNESESIENAERYISASISRAVAALGVERTRTSIIFSIPTEPADFHVTATVDFDYVSSVSDSDSFDLRHTGYVIEELYSDRERCYCEIMKLFDEERNLIDQKAFEFWGRQLVRSSFAYIEGVTFSLKLAACRNIDKLGMPITSTERALCVEVAYDLDDKGNVVERVAQIKLDRNIKFAFQIANRAFNSNLIFDPSVEWWSCFKEAIKIRDRFMHPRLPKDLDVDAGELLSVTKATDGFRVHVHGLLGLDLNEQSPITA